MRANNFSAKQQLSALGISAEAYEDLVIIEMDRSFMSFTPREIRRFHGFLQQAYREAQGRPAGTPRVLG